MLEVQRRALSRDRVDSIATTVLVVPAGSSRCLWMLAESNTKYEDAERDYTVCQSIHRALLSDGCWGGEKNIIIVVIRCCSAHRLSRQTRLKLGAFKGADAWIGCRYSLSPLVAAASRFAPTTPTCFLSIKPTATASQHRREDTLSRDQSWAQSGL